MAQYTDINLREELVEKYKLAGRIRFIMFFLLSFFLVLMKYFAGYPYINVGFLVLICIVAILNQPYGFFVNRFNINRLQYYQMTVDIILISWILHYMGGLSAPIVSVAYYAVILWAGVVSGSTAVLFSVLVSTLMFSSIVILEHIGLIQHMSFYEYNISNNQMACLLLGNIFFMFAFGYFSALCSKNLRLLQIKREEELLRHTHKLVATGSLISQTAHDIVNQLSGVKGYADILLKDKGLDESSKRMLESSRDLALRGVNLMKKLSLFSKETKQEFEPVDIKNVFEDALEVCWPLIRHSKMKINKKFAIDLPNITANRNQLQELFFVFLTNAMEAISGEGTFTIEAQYNRKEDLVEVVLSDTGKGIEQEDLKRLGTPFFTTKGPGRDMGLVAAYDIIKRHKGKVDVKSTVGMGTTFKISLPIK